MNKDDKQLESVKRAFEHWRKTRKKQGKVKFLIIYRNRLELSQAVIP